MAAENSFDVACKIDMQEVTNAIDQARRDIATRYRASDYAETYRERYPNYEFVRRRLPVLADNVRRVSP